MALVFAVIHLHNIFNFSLLLSVPFLYCFKSMEGSTIPECPSHMCFFNRGNTEGTNSLKIMCLMFIYIYVLFDINLCQD